MSLNKIRWSITAVCAVLAGVHFHWPSLALDTTSTILLVIAVIPWLAPVIKSIELPGGFKIEVQDIKAATDKVTSGAPPGELLPHSQLAPPQTPLPAPPPDPFSLIAEIAEKDPNLALVAFRIELEKRLVTLAEQNGISETKRGAGFLLRQLQAKRTIPLSVASGLSELIALGNQAAHGASVSPDAAQWVLEVGPSVLGLLDGSIRENQARL